MTNETIFVGEVADTFQLPGRPGVIVAPATLWAAELKMGDSLEIVKPNGDVLQVEIRGFEMIKTTQPFKRTRGCSILIQANNNNLCRDDVPLGSQIWRA